MAARSTFSGTTHRRTSERITASAFRRQPQPELLHSAGFLLAGRTCRPVATTTVGVLARTPVCRLSPLPMYRYVQREKQVEDVRVGELRMAVYRRQGEGTHQEGASQVHADCT